MIGYVRGMKLFAALLVTLTLSLPTVARADDAADLERFVSWFEKLADQVTADKTDCTKVATDINTSIDSNKDLMDKAKAARAAGKQMPKPQMDRMIAAGQKMGQALGAKCGNDKGVQAAVQRLPGPKHK